MIVEWLYDIWNSVVTFFVGLLPSGNMPDWMTDLTKTITDVFTAINGLGAWAPWAYIGVVVTAVFASYGVSFGIKLVLRAISHAPVSGGAG